MRNPITKIQNPALPLASFDYNQSQQDQYTNVLRLFFNRMVTSLNLTIDRVNAPEVITFAPTTEPANPEAGWVYYDSGTNKLRCYNGTIWNDLF